MNRRRAVTPRRRLPAVLLLVVGVLLAVGAPTAWALTHRDPALTAVGPGIAVALAESATDGGQPGSTGAAAASAGTTATTSDAPVSPPSATLAGVPTATTPNAAAPASRAASTPAEPTGTTEPTSPAKPTAAKSTAAKSTALQSTAVKPTAVKPTAVQPTAVTPTAAVQVRPPAQLRIPAIGVDAPVGPVGVDDRGEMAIPQQVQDVGWYRYGPAPGASQGSAVLSGHVDSAQQGLGAFSRLGELEAGDVITVIDTAGRQLNFKVVGKEAFDKKTVPLADLFSRTGAARLTLITCGGAFDPAARSYLDNIVVTAVPA